MSNQEKLLGMVEISKREAQIMLEAGYVYLEWQKPEVAEEIFLGVSSLLPKSDAPLVALGNLYSSTGRSKDAENAYREAINQKPDSSIAYAFLGEELLLSKQFAKAEEALAKAKSLDPEEGAAFNHATSLLKAHELGVFN